jgi:hypothetical protein
MAGRRPQRKLPHRERDQAGDDRGDDADNEDLADGPAEGFEEGVVELADVRRKELRDERAGAGQLGFRASRRDAGDSPSEALAHARELVEVEGSCA